ncbi:MAG: (2Fe-2S)-binding protein [bacterium]|nr:(2Fe-2S)-binding protein [bacterium]
MTAGTRRLQPGRVEEERFTILADGVPVPAWPGESIAAALLAGARSPAYFCGMGICRECVVVVNGQAGVRACMTPAAPGMAVDTPPRRGSQA